MVINRLNHHHVMLNMILYTLWQSFPFKFLFQCWGPCDILHCALQIDSFNRKKDTQGKFLLHTKLWYPCRESWLVWVKVLVRRSLQTRSLTGVFKFGTRMRNLFHSPSSLTLENRSVAGSKTFPSWMPGPGRWPTKKNGQNFQKKTNFVFRPCLFAVGLIPIFAL